MPVSIALCVPAYNAEAHLPGLLESAARQTVPFDEVWIYDDASTDETSAVARRFGARVLRGEINQGCSAGKNALLALVETAWVHFHDADDILAPEFVARAKARIGDARLDVLLFDYEQVDGVTGARMSRSDFGASSLLQDPVRYNLVNTVNNGGVYSVPFLRRVGGFDLDPAVRFNEDRAFHLRLAEAEARFGVEPYVGCQFQYFPSSMSSANRARCCRANHEITKRFARRHPGRYQEELGEMSWRDAAGLASCLEWEGADSCVRLACSATGRVPREGSVLFKALCLIHPFWAIRVREALIRAVKPRFRQRVPRVGRTERRRRAGSGGDVVNSSDAPLVSVLIPCYNAGRWIDETLDSVLAQTWPNVEIIVVDDGSTDDSGAILDGYAARGVTCIHQPNRGKTAALNRCLHGARGEFVQYLDADDLLAPDKIELQVSRLTEAEGCIATAKWARFSDTPAVSQVRTGRNVAGPGSGRLVGGGLEGRRRNDVSGDVAASQADSRSRSARGGTISRSSTTPSTSPAA